MRARVWFVAVAALVGAGCASMAREEPRRDATEAALSSSTNAAREAAPKPADSKAGGESAAPAAAAPAEARSGDASTTKSTAETADATRPSGASTGAATGAPPAAAPTTRPASRPQAEASGLRAGYADDNKQFNYFVQFLERYAQEVEQYPLDVQERIVFRVKDSSGLPVANAEVEVVGGGFPLLKAKSHADGTVLFFPRLYTLQKFYVVNTTALGRSVETIVDREGKREVDIALPAQRSLPPRVPLDIVFVLDTTGSMGEEIERLKLTIELINLNLVSVSTNPLVRFGLVLYKDAGDEYVTRVVQPTDDLAAFQVSLGSVVADGGGDTPEDLQSALEEAMRSIAWNRDGIRLAFVITDAPPHLDYGAPYTYVQAARDAQTLGIKIHSVGTGGLDIGGEYVLRQLSQFTHARYIFLTYGEQGEAEGGVAGSVSHHTGANFQTDKLESIIIRFAREELAFQSVKPLEEGEEYFEAFRVSDEEREQTLAKLFELAIGQLADYSSARLPASTRVATVPLVPSDALLAAQAEYLSEQLLVSLSRSQLFRIVERKDLQKILEEMELQLSGLVDDSQAAKVGNLLGAEVLVTGRLYAKEDRYEVFLKLLRVETGEILSATKARVDRKLGI